MEKIVGFTPEEILNLYSKNSPGWNDRLAHVSRVYHLCKKFSISFPEANKKILLTSALLHDIGHSYKGDHAKNGAKIVLDILPKKGYSVNEINQISSCIKTHSLKGKNKPLTIEGKILADCDRLDVINLDTWIQVLDSKTVKSGKISESILECINWEKEWLNLGTEFFTSKGKEEFQKILVRKQKIINEIKNKSLIKIRRGILIHHFTKDFRKILLVKRKKDKKWGVIAGTSEKDEDFIRTAVREFQEEANISRFLFEMFPSELEFNSNLHEKSLDVLQNYCSVAKTKDILKVNFTKEIEKLSWKPINNLPKKMIPTRIEKNKRNFLKYGN